MLPLEQALAEGDSWRAAGSITARGVFHKNRTARWSGAAYALRP